ncbi:MAG: Hsp70 family protein [Phycisphaerales bacterium]
MAFGIDFGTTNSAVVYENRLLDDGGRPFPSVVAIHPDTGEVYCGTKAKNDRSRLTAAGFMVIRSVKRLLESDQSWLVTGKLLKPVDVAAILFGHLKEHARRSGNTDGHVLERAVVSIPVSWPAARRRLLRQAAAQAGIEVQSFVSEPTAAYFRCRKDLPPCRRVAVFDWGGGTLDIAVLAIEGARIQELGTAVREEAGDALDVELARWCHTQLVRGVPNAPAFDDMSAEDRENLVVECERAKVDLSKLPERDIVLPKYGGRTSLPTVTLSREDLARVSKPLVDRAIETLLSGLEKARVSTDDVEVFLVVGGSSRLASLQARLDELFPSRVFNTPTPDWDVAEGAALLAHQALEPVLLQSVCLSLADGESLQLVGPGTPFDDRPRPFTLGVVEATNSAMLVFSESIDGTASANRLRFIHAMSVPTMGFFLEPIDLTLTLTEDLTMSTEGKSRNGNGSDSVRWEYSGLRFAYDMPNGVARHE